jgi:hypothetical protein
METMKKVMAGETPPPQRLPAEIVVRKSSGPPPTQS